MRLFAFADEASPIIDRQIEAMSRNGLQGLEIRMADHVNVSDLSLAKAREIRKKLDDAGLIVWSIGSPLGKIDVETGDFPTHLERFRHTLDLAHVLGAENIRLFSFYIPQGKDPSLYRQEILDRLGRFLSYAAGSGIDLCHENEKGIYGDIAARCLDLHRSLPALKGIFDPANFVQCGQDTLQAWQQLQPYIKYLHIKDALPDGSVVPAGHGTGNLPSLLRAYRQQGDALTLEPHLTVFDGLKNLEQEGNTSHVGQYVYASADEAFDTACSTLKALLQNL